MSNVTCILTSCGRFDLLRITLDSFFKYNTYDIKEFWAYEDSCNGIPADIIEDYPMIKWIEKLGNCGDQIHALDTLWAMVGTEYAFQMEDDWETMRPGFIERSMEILEENKNILQVWLIHPEPKNSHPITWGNVLTTYEGHGVPKYSNYGILKSGPSLWAWHRFNPSLKRKADYDLIAPFSKHTTFNKNKGWKSEAAISQVYNKLGFTAAILPEVYIKHIGNERRCI